MVLGDDYPGLQQTKKADRQCNGEKHQRNATPRMFERTLVYELARYQE
jgi:hypothetical protein